MALEVKIYTDGHRLRRFFSNNFRETDTKSVPQEYEIMLESLYPPDSSEITLTLISTNDIYNKITEILSKSEVVDKIFIIREENTFCIWTSLYKYDKNSRYALYSKELEVIKYFSKIEFHFNFHLAEPDDIEELLASGAKRIYPKS
ncbi:MAG: hypothetical protein FJZ16_01490 [Candidatus Omnitrophica bacterium]|nr:hypothetical protein [Candidatus Omnitrophota bacterium]